MHESVIYNIYNTTHVEELRQCVHAFEVYYAQKGGRSPRDENFSYLMTSAILERVEKESGVIWCAWVGDQMVGFCVGVVEESTQYDYIAEGVQHLYGKVTDIFVRDEVRGQDIGSQLIRHTEQVLKEKGVTKIHLEVIVDNDEVVSFYEKNGYKKESIVLAKKI